MASKTIRKGQSFIDKLRNREIHGSFVKNVTAPSNKAKLLFGNIPSRLRFHLKTVIEDMGNHILMGMTQCGQFILTYSFTMDQTQTNNRSIYGSSYFKYRLHWWRFRVNAPAVMVAEVPLFEIQDIHDVLTIGIAQWPSVSNKILVYGQSFSTPQIVDASEFRKIYITITVNPSLGNCKDCSNVKKSMEEDISDNWNADVGSRCLRHGLTVHTMFSVFPPFPAIDLSFALKDENQIIVNTGNSLHVLFVDLEDNNSYNDVTKREDSIVNDELRHKIGAKLTSKEYDYKVPVVNNITDSRTKNEQLLNNLTKRFISRNIDMNKMKSCLQNPDCDNQCENCKSDCDDSFSVRSCKRSKGSSVSSAKSKEACLRQIANQVYDFAESDESCNLKFKWYRRRTIADKMYEFCSDDDENTENIHPLSLHFGSNTSLSILRSTTATVRARKTCEIDLDDVDRLSVASHASETSDLAEAHLPCMSPMPRCTLEAATMLNRDKCWIYENENECSAVAGHSKGSTQLNGTCDKVRQDLNTSSLDQYWLNENESSSNSGQSGKTFSKLVAGTSQLNVTCDSVWLDWETTSLSPRSDVSYSTNANVECSELKLDSARSFLENLPSMGSSESCSPKCVSPMAVKCYPGSANNKDRTAKTKDGPTLKRFFCRENRLNSFLKHYPLKFATGTEKDASKETDPTTHCTVDAHKEVTQDRWLVPCRSTRFEKRYIELDEEILSTVTDIDGNLKLSHKVKLIEISTIRRVNNTSLKFPDKNEKRNRNSFVDQIELHKWSLDSLTFVRLFPEGTVDEDGVNYALTLSVHGSGYSQMQVITNNKVEKLNVPCCVVRQDSLDIEQFSYKVAVIICKCQGYKFRFCNDYDIEIVDVCPLNGDILAVVFLRINADPPIGKGGSSESKVAKEPKDPRQFFETRCLFIWNAKSRACWLEAFTPLVEDTSSLSLNNNGSVQRNPARMEALKLKALSLGFFDVPLVRPTRYFEHLVFDNIRFGPSLQVIEDELNMIGFFREPDDVILGMAEDSDYSLSDYDDGQMISEDDD